MNDIRKKLEDEGLLDDAYSSVEGMLYPWFDERELWPDKVGRGDIQDLAVKVTRMIKPFRDLFRAYEGWDGYDLGEALEAARIAERDL